MTKDPSELAHAKELDYENAIASRYNRDYHEPPIMARHSRDFGSFVSKYVREGDRVLDLGCGSASLWNVWPDSLPPLGALVGVDLSPNMLEEARLLYPSGDFREGNFMGIPSGSGEFDIVIISSALHHINDACLPACLREVDRVLDEHGTLLGREPLISGRLSDRGGWFSGALMHLRHLAYRLTGTREYPEPDPGPDHHAYHGLEFISIVDQFLSVTELQARNPVSPFLARIKDQHIADIALHLDEFLGHRQGQELFYAARKNFSSSADVSACIAEFFASNHITPDELRAFMAELLAATNRIEQLFPSSENKWL
jgi:SAM-dependent methyltransferase